MIPGASNQLLAGSSRGYVIANSLRLRGSASAYLSRTPGSAGNRRTFTFSDWVKRGTLGTSSTLFTAGTNSSNNFRIAFNISNQLTVENEVAGVVTTYRATTAVYRDPSAWYHIVLAVDTTQATAADRIKLYVNGVEVTAFGTNNAPALNFDLPVNNNVEHRISASFTPTYADWYKAEMRLVDGLQLTPASFGALDTNGVWAPRGYGGAYGTNGWWLRFNDGSSTTNLCLDRSGNGNNWTPSNISVTAGATYDWMSDTPTNVYCTLSPITPPGGTSTTITDGNLATNVASTTTFGKPLGTFGMSTGKWYWETTITAVGSAANVGISDGSLPSGSFGLGGVAGEIAYQSTGNKYTGNSSTAYGASYTTNDVIGVAYDADAGSITFYKNNASQGAITGFSGTKFPAVGSGGGTNPQYALNFGQRPLTYSPPSGFKALCSANLPAVTIANPKRHFNTVLYVGDGSTSKAVTGVGFQPDFLWIKNRANAYDHQLFDAVRGLGSLASNGTSAEQSYGNLNSFDADGFTVDITGSISTNTNLANHVAWNWKANGAGVTNTAGSITSTVSANTTAGFSIVTYTGTGANATVGHGLGTVPKMVIVKRRVDTPYSWVVWHSALAGTEYVTLDTTNAKTTDATIWNSTVPNSSVFSVGTQTSLNASTKTYVAYVFSEVPGFSRFGSYTGNANADGVFVYCGFRPRYLLIKSSTTAQNWHIIDTARDTYNLAGQGLDANTSAVEFTPASSGYPLDILSNGFKLRFASEPNTSATYIFAAFAENPMGGQNVAPAPAR